MRDIGANTVPLSDTEAYFDTFTAEFSAGVQFSTRECKQYGPVADALVICKIRPLAAGAQTLDIYDDQSLRFKNYPL